MKKTMLLALGVAVVGAAAFLADVRPAKAVPQFRTEFVAKYVKAGSSDPKDKAFAEMVEKINCNVCHVGEDKEKRNPYGEAMSKFVSKTDRRNKEKIRKALDKLAGVKCKADDAKSPTYGQRIASGKLPCDPAP